MKIELHSGISAKVWLADTRNIDAWGRLYREIDFDLPYLTSEFAQLWADFYGDSHELIFVIATNDAGDLRALLPLARRQDLITGLGTYHAEYQGWLAASDVNTEFLSVALTHLRAAYPSALVRIRYVLPGPNSAALESLVSADSRAQLVGHQQPLLEIVDAEIDATLKKKANRSKFNRLKRMGDLRLQRITDIAGFDQYMDDIIAAYDFRQGGHNDSCPFFEDPAKRPFHRAWLERCTNQLYVSLLTLNDRPVAAYFGVVIGGYLANAIVSHDPRVALHSTSKLHIYLLAQELAGENFRGLDLTPGGEWKDRYATRHQTVYELRYWNSAKSHLRNRLNEQLMHYARLAIERAGMTTAKLRTLASTFTRITPVSIARRLRNCLWLTTEYRVYRMRLSGWTRPQDASHAQVDSLGDLVAFDDTVAWETRAEFLNEASERLSRGESVYTVREDQRLLHYGWINPSQLRSKFSEVDYDYDYPNAGAVIYDFFTHPSARGRGLYQNTILQMLSDLAAAPAPQEWVYISVLARNAPSRHVIEKLGFEYVESVLRKTRFGLESKVLVRTKPA